MCVHYVTLIVTLKLTISTSVYLQFHGNQPALWGKYINRIMCSIAGGYSDIIPIYRYLGQKQTERGKDKLGERRKDSVGVNTEQPGCYEHQYNVMK